MSEIHWSKAPEGAEYFAPEHGGWSEGWYRFRDESWEFHLGGNDHWSPVTTENVDRKRPLEARPTQWRGPEDGLPPVGAEVEAWIENRNAWAKVTVLAVDVDTVVWRNGTDRRSYVGTHVDDVRPLKSDKERAVDAAMRASGHEKVGGFWTGSLDVYHAFGKAYDAGFLRLPEDQS